MFNSAARVFIKYLVISGFLFFGLTGSYAQKVSCATTCDCEIEGRVNDHVTGAPLAFASILVAGTETGTFSDENGVFHLHGLCSDEFDLQVSFVGYKTSVHHHDIYHGSPQIFLAPAGLQLESVVVEGKKKESDFLSVTETRLRPEELENSGHESLGSLLQNITGVSALKTGQNVVKPVVHGLHSSRVLIINNGVRHESQSWGREHAPEIDPSLAHNITLIKGAAAVRYGPDALGGVIIFNPLQPELSVPLKGRIEVNGQSIGRAGTGTLFLQQGSSRFAWTAQASGLYQGDLHAPDYVLKNTGAREFSLGAGMRYHIKSLDLSVFYSKVNQEFGILRGSVVGNLDDLANAIGSDRPAGAAGFSYTINNPRQTTSHQLLKLEGNYAFSAHSSLDLQYGLQLNKRQEYDIRRGTNNERPSLNLELSSHTFDGRWSHATPGSFNGSVGVQGLYQQNANIAGTNTIPYIPNYTNTRAGLYVTESVELGNIIAEAGLRYDILSSSVTGRDSYNEVFRNNFNYQNFTGTVGIQAPLGPHFSFQSSLGTAWRPPNVSELYSFGKHEFIVEYGLWRYLNGVTEIYTQAERPVNSEMGLKMLNTFNYQKQKTALELTAYVNYLRDYIYTRPAGITTTVRGAFPFFIHDQTNALFIGLDGSLLYDHTINWQSHFKMSLLTARDIKNSGFFVGTPPGRLSYNLRYLRDRLGFMKNFSAGMQHEYTLKQFQAPEVRTVAEILAAKEQGTDMLSADSRNFDFLPAPDAYYLLHIYTSFHTGRFSYRLQLRNLLNTSYRDYTDRLRYFSDDTGRNILFTLKYAF